MDESSASLLRSCCIAEGPTVRIPDPGGRFYSSGQLQDGFYALRKAHMLHPVTQEFPPNVAFKTVPINVGLIDGGGALSRRVL